MALWDSVPYYEYRAGTRLINKKSNNKLAALPVLSEPGHLCCDAGAALFGWNQSNDKEAVHGSSSISSSDLYVLKENE